MAGLVVTIAQRKGGAGKSTLAAQLAVAWAKERLRVAVLDIDPQGSLAGWADLRRARLGEAAIGFDFVALPGWRAAQWIADRARHCDLVVIDSPPHVETEARIAVRAAGLVLIPVQPSPLDLWATEATLAMVRDERRPVLAVLNRVPPRGVATERIAACLVEMSAPAAAARIGNRVALVRAMTEGLGVIETAAGSPAAAEIAALAAEVRGAAPARRAVS
jgi:chromosome partitioning protein